MKLLFYKILKKLVFFKLEFENKFINKIIKQYYTEFVYKQIKNIGLGVQINGKIKIFNYKGLTIGNNVHIGDNCFINAEGGVIIGDNCQLSRNISIYSSSHNYEGDALPYDQTLRTKQVIIGKNVWIGMNVSIAPGVKVGDGAILGIGSVINRDVSEGSIIVQSGFKSISKRNMEHYTILDKAKKYAGSNGNILNFETINDFYKPISESKQIVFIIPTGVVGGKNLLNSLKEIKNVKGFNERNWELMKYSIEYAYGIISRVEAKDYLLEIYNKVGVASSNDMYVESNRYFLFFIDILVDLFPNSKFIFCLEGEDIFIESAIEDDWYKFNSCFDNKGRLLLNRASSSYNYQIEGDKIGDLSVDQWTNFDQRDKCKWYFNYSNRIIKNQLSYIKKDNWLKLDINNIQTEMSNVLKLIGKNIA